MRRTTLLTAPLELRGSWRDSSPKDAGAVVEHMRTACLAGFALVSDRQPERLRVDDRSGNNPSIWLHTEDPAMAWITVVVETRDWCNLAYQFGHELGHVLCNSWEVESAPRNPCQWIEEALVEAFSLRGLGRLACGWERSPPFAGDEAYAWSIRDYAARILAGHRDAAMTSAVPATFEQWFRIHKPILDDNGSVGAASGAVSTMLDLLEDDAATIADLGALNRWSERGGVPLADYLDLWEGSCAELRSPGRLPAKLRALLAGNSEDPASSSLSGG